MLEFNVHKVCGGILLTRACTYFPVICLMDTLSFIPRSCNSPGQKILLPENTPTSSLPALAAQTMAAGRVKHLVIEDGPSLLATLQLLISRGVTDKHVLLVIYSLTPVLMMQQVDLYPCTCHLPSPAVAHQSPVYIIIVVIIVINVVIIVSS